MSDLLDGFIRSAPDPASASNRIDRLCSDPAAAARVEGLVPAQQKKLVDLVGFSHFLFNHLVRYPEAITRIDAPLSEDMSAVRSFDDLRRYKYDELLKITSLDLAAEVEYRVILNALSRLAIDTLNHSMRLMPEFVDVYGSVVVLALGKLGAHELNFSSDIDLIFVTENPGASITAYQELQERIIKFIRTLNRNLEERTVDGFLYRVDQKLRPWGGSGPLCMALDDTENYYAAVSQPWERFAWLRARQVAGSAALGAELFENMRPFVFRRALDAEDLVKFVQIKHDMDRARRRSGYWNVKVGEGGIRDIEFFTQVLQIVNAGVNDSLQSTSTMTVMNELCRAGHISSAELAELMDSYLFLRRLENHLQMIDERQTHDLPDERDKRLLLARSMAMPGPGDSVLDDFEDTLLRCQTAARRYFDRVLPGDNRDIE